jgi:hypothetical protein
LTPLGERAGEEVEGEERSISRSSNTDGEEDGGVASIADRERQEQVTGEGERRGCLDLQLSVMCAQTWNKREAKKSMQVVWWWQWQECSLLSPPNTQGSGQQAGGGEASSTALRPVRGQWHKRRCLRSDGTQKHKREGEHPVLHGEPGRKTKGRIFPQVYLRFALGFCEEIRADKWKASGHKWELTNPLLINLFPI